MNLRETISVLWRRWPIVLAVLVIGSGATALTASTMSDSFQASARFVLLSPSGSNSDVPVKKLPSVNPYSLFGSRQDTSVTVIEDLMSSDSVHRDIQEKGIVGQWSVTAPLPFRPILEITAVESSPEAAYVAIWRLVDYTKGMWTAHQRDLGVPDGSLLVLELVSQPSEPMMTTGSKARVVAGCGLLVLMAALGGALIFEGLARRRARSERSGVRRVARARTFAFRWPEAPLLDRPLGGGARRAGSLRLRPGGALTVYLCLLLLVPSVFVLKGAGSFGVLAVLFSVVLFGWWVLSRFVLGDPMDVGLQPVRILCALFAAAMIVSWLAANRALLPAVQVRQSDRAVMTVVGLAGVVLVAADGLGWDDLQRLLRRLVSLGVLLSAIAQVQYAIKTDFVTPIFSRIPILAENRNISSDFAGKSTFTDLVRPVGLTTHPIELGVTLALILPVAFYFAVFDVEKRPLARWWRPGLIAVTLPLTQSRSGLLTLALAAVIYLPFVPPSVRKTLIKAAPVGAVALFVAFPGLLASIVYSFLDYKSDPSYQMRQSDYAVIPGLVSRHMWFGQGIGTWLPSGTLVFDNQTLLTLVETGFVGLIALGLLLFGAALTALQASHWAVTEQQRSLGIAICAALVGSTMGFVSCDFLALYSTTGVFVLYLGVAGALWRLFRADAAARGWTTPPCSAGRRIAAARVPVPELVSVPG